MRFTYTGPFVEVEVAGQVVAQGDDFDGPPDLADQPDNFTPVVVKNSKKES